METNLYNDRNGIIKSRDLRVCCFYSEWLRINKRIDNTAVSQQNADSCRQTLNQLIKQHFPNIQHQINLLAEMEVGREANILPTEDFDWINQDERAAFWLWAYLYKISDYQLGINPHENAMQGNNWYKTLKLSLSPSSHQERIKLIMTFFDSIIIHTPPVNHLKKHTMEKLKDTWKNIYSKPAPLKWLPDDEGAVIWAWNSLQKIQQKKSEMLGGFTYGLVPYSPGLTTWFTPLNNSERCLALRAALDLWDEEPDTKRLFLLNLNKSWNQKKLRQSRTDKKALNTYLKNETKIRLDIMAEHNGLRISDMLEKLINEHYKTTFTKNNNTRG